MQAGVQLLVSEAIAGPRIEPAPPGRGVARWIDEEHDAKPVGPMLRASTNRRLDPRTGNTFTNSDGGQRRDAGEVSGLPRLSEIVGTPHIDPELGSRAGKPGETQCGIETQCGHTLLQPFNPSSRHSRVSCAGSSHSYRQVRGAARTAPRPGERDSSRASSAAPSMTVHDLDVSRPIFCPHEAGSPRVIDSNRALPGPVSPRFLQPASGREPGILRYRRSVHRRQHRACSLPQVCRESPAIAIPDGVRCTSTACVHNHGQNVSWPDTYGES